MHKLKSQEPLGSLSCTCRTERRVKKKKMVSQPYSSCRKKTLSGALFTLLHPFEQGGVVVHSQNRDPVLVWPKPLPTIPCPLAAASGWGEEM